MKIRSKKNKRASIQEITQDQWAEMTSRGEHTFFNVIDPSDEHLGTETIKVEPIEFVNDDLAEAPYIERENTIDAEEEIQFYRDYLDEMEVEYDKRLGLKKLKKLYEENI